jgi:hypothetical protein
LPGSGLDPSEQLITAAFWEIIWVTVTNVLEQRTASIFRTQHFLTLKKEAEVPQKH